MDPRYTPTIAARLTSRLAVRPSGCIEWTGSVDEHGYGRITRGARGTGYAGTHRVAWEVFNQASVPDGQYVLHRCDNPPCCNPGHLFLGTLEDNARDMMAKGRGHGQLPAGAEHPSARLTDEQIAEARRLAPIIGNYAALGRLLGVSKQHARSIALGTKRSVA